MDPNGDWLRQRRSCALEVQRWSIACIIHHPQLITPNPLLEDRMMKACPSVPCMTMARPNWCKWRHIGSAGSTNRCKSTLILQKRKTKPKIDQRERGASMIVFVFNMVSPLAKSRKPQTSYLMSIICQEQIRNERNLERLHLHRAMNAKTNTKILAVKCYSPMNQRKQSQKSNKQNILLPL